MRHRNGFTLLEVLVALALAGMVITMAIQAWTISIRMSQAATKVRSSNQILSGVLQVIRNEVKKATEIKTVEALTANRLYDAERSNTELTVSVTTNDVGLWGDDRGFCIVDSMGDLRGIMIAGYQPSRIRWKEKLRDLTIPLREPGVLRLTGHVTATDVVVESIAQEVQQFKCEYFDGQTWNNAWEPTASSSFPLAIRLHVKLNSGETAQDVIALQTGDRA